MIQMRLLSGEDEVDMDELDRALTVVRRRMDAAAAGAASGLLSSIDGAEDNSVPGMRRRLQQAQVRFSPVEVEVAVQFAKKGLTAFIDGEEDNSVPGMRRRLQQAQVRSSPFGEEVAVCSLRTRGSSSKHYESNKTSCKMQWQQASRLAAAAAGTGKIEPI